MTLDELAELERRLGVEFEDRDLLRRALTHRSYAFENGGLDTNERLEFLGDAVLSLVVTDEIFHAYPASSEGRLAKYRAAAVRASALAAVARELGLGRFILLGKGEAASGGADKDSILADALEAVLGAVHVDQGYHVAAELVLRLFAQTLEEISWRGALDFKTSLQELAAARFDSLPTYRVTGRGPDHEKVFTAVVAIGERELGRGQGRSKKRAEQAAAREAYRRLDAERGDCPEGDDPAAGVRHEAPSGDARRVQ